MQLEVDLNEVRKFITDPEFGRFLLEHTTDFTIAAYILQILLDATDSAVVQTECPDP